MNQFYCLFWNCSHTRIFWIDWNHFYRKEHTFPWKCLLWRNVASKYHNVVHCSFISNLCEMPYTQLQILALKPKLVHVPYILDESVSIKQAVCTNKGHYYWFRYTDRFLFFFTLHHINGRSTFILLVSIETAWLNKKWSKLIYKYKVVGTLWTVNSATVGDGLSF